MSNTVRRFKNPRVKRHFRIRKKLFGTAERPRICVFRSAKHIYAQAVDDLTGKTIASSSSMSKDLPSIEGDMTAKRKTAKAVGKRIAEALKEKGIEKAVFDRGGYLYHGRVAALADGVREAGLTV